MIPINISTNHKDVIHRTLMSDPDMLVYLDLSKTDWIKVCIAEINLLDLESTSSQICLHKMQPLEIVNYSIFCGGITFL